MKPVVIVLTVLAIALGAGGGFVTGFTMTLIERVRTDLQLGCALMQSAENAGYLTMEQRSKLIDKVVPPVPKDVELRPETNWIKAFVHGWWDAIREDLKSGCRGSASPVAEGRA